MYNSDSGKKSLINVEKVSNGWIVTVHQHNRDIETSPETLARRERERKDREKDSLQREKQRMFKDISTQLASMAVIGEVAGKVQTQAIDEEIDSWKPKKDNLSPEVLLKKMDPVISKIVDQTVSPRSVLPSPFLSTISAAPGIETYIFQDRVEMISFVSEMLTPIQE